MYDSATHGWEDYGTEVFYHYCKWLLTSNNPTAKEILAHNRTLIIPIVNMDSVVRENANYTQCKYGVDLNRNFVSGWVSTSCGQYPNSYHGKIAGSEPEVQAVRSQMATYKPAFYLCTHVGASYLASHSSNNSTTVTNVRDRIKQLSAVIKSGGVLGVKPYSNQSFGGKGYTFSDAHAYGATAFMLEMCQEGSATTSWIPSEFTYRSDGTRRTGSNWFHTAFTADEMRTLFFPKCLPILIAFSEAAYSKARGINTVYNTGATIAL